jgi:hypothetical protein
MSQDQESSSTSETDDSSMEQEFEDKLMKEDSEDNKRKREEEKEGEGEPAKKKRRTSRTVSPFDDGGRWEIFAMRDYDPSHVTDIDNCLNEIKQNHPNGANMMVKHLEPSQIRLRLSEEQKKQKRTEYRQMYQKMPHVVEKRLARESDPEVKEKRRIYASRPDVKEKKKERTKIRQCTTKILKATRPDIYKEVESKAKEVIKNKIAKVLDSPHTPQCLLDLTSQ